MVEISIPAAVGVLVALICHFCATGPSIRLRCKRAAISFGLAAMTVLCFAPEFWDPSLWILGIFLLIVLYQLGAILCMVCLWICGCLKRATVGAAAEN